MKVTQANCHGTDHVSEKQIKRDARAQGHGELIKPGNYRAFEIADKLNLYYLVTWMLHPYTSQQDTQSGNTFIPAGEQIVDADYWSPVIALLPRIGITQQPKTSMQPLCISVMYSI